MAPTAETQTINERYQTIPIHERHLTEIDHLAKHRQADGSYPETVLADVLSNLKTAVQEGGIPHAVSSTQHEYTPTSERTGVFTWMGKTAVQNAMSGYRFHIHEAAQKRVDVEVDEAHHAQEDLRPGVMKVFISPRMSQKDAPFEVAKQEHLADDDAVRVSWLETDDNGAIQQRVLQSLLVKDIPLEAWVSLLQDPNNPFGKVITVDDPESALSVMQIHRELEVPAGSLPDGPVDIVRAVLPHIADKQTHSKVAKQIKLFESDQAELDEQAEYVAQKWLEFEVEIDKSFHAGQTTLEIERFIAGLQHKWKKEDLELINNHLIDDGYVMTRELAVILEKAKQNTLWATAGILSNNQTVLKQIDPEIAQQIIYNETQIFAAQQAGLQAHSFQSMNNQLIASQNIAVGGGCSGSNNNSFKNATQADDLESDGNSESKDWKTNPKSWKKGVCRIKACPTRPGSTKVGPCEVCVGCQSKFDSGSDPSK